MTRFARASAASGSVSTQTFGPQGDEAVEQGLDDVAPLLLVAGRAGADVKKGEAVAAGLLDLMAQQQNTGRLLLHLALSDGGQRHHVPITAHRASKDRRDHIADLEIAEPEPARIVAFEQRELAIEGARMGIEDLAHAHGRQLARFLREERVHDRELLVACFRPAIGQRRDLAELALFALEIAARALAEAPLEQRLEIAERDRIAGAWRRLVRQEREGVGNALPTEGLRPQQRRCRARLAGDRLKQAPDVGGLIFAGRARREQTHIVIGVLLAEPAQHRHAQDGRGGERPQEQQRTLGVTADGDDRLAALGPEPMAGPGPRPAIGLRRRAGSLRLQLFPEPLEPVEILGNAERDGTEARRHDDGPAPLCSGFGDLGFGTEEGSRTHAGTIPLPCPRSKPSQRQKEAAAIVLQGTPATMLVSRQNHGRGGLMLDG